MGKYENSLIVFIDKFKEIKSSFNDVLFNKSFNTDIIKVNIEMVKNHRYAITDNIWNINDEENSRFIATLLLLTRLYANEYSDDIGIISNMLDKDKSLSKKLIIDILTNKQKKISDFARVNGISNDFIIFFSIFIAYPYREAVAKIIQQELNLKDHSSGFCPVCGHWPGMSYIVEKEGKKLMACICCGTVWSFKRLKCSFCLSSESNDLGFLNIEGDDAISAYTCDSCRRYLKTGKIENANTDLPEEKLFVDYMSSGNIDIVALQNKYLQESMLGTRFDGPNDHKIDLYIKNY